MKTTIGKSIIQNQSRKLIAKITLFLFTPLLFVVPTHAGVSSDMVTKAKNQVQNMSTDISECEAWYALVSESTNATPWHDLLDKTDQGYLKALIAIKSEGPLSPLNQIAQGFFQDELSNGGNLSPENFQKIMNKMPTCEAYVASTDINNYTLESGRKMGIGDGSSGSDGTDQVNTQMVQCMSQANQQAQQQCMQQAMQNGNMQCKHDAYETHDYLNCKKLATFVMGFAVGKSAMQLQQGFRVGNANIDAQQGLIQKQNSTEGVGMADTLGVQRDSLKQQGEMAYEMAAYNAGKAGILLAMISKFPTRKKMYEQCVSNIDARKEELIKLHNNDLKDKITPYNIPDFYAGTEGAEALCDRTLLRNDGDHNDKFFENQEILDKIKQMAMQAGLEAVANGVQGALLNKQAGIVDDAIGDIKTFEKPNFEQAGFQPSLASECTVNPNAEGCITLGGATTSGFGSQSFGSTGSGSANLGNATLSGTDTTGTNSAAATKRNLLPNSVGSVQVGQPNKGGFSDPKVAAGTIKPGQGRTSGGSSGGGSAGGAALPAGGGPNRPGGQAPAARSGKAAIKVGLNGSGLGRVSGGRGSIGRKSKSTSANPFAKLLGKTKGSASTLNFRGPAQIGKSKGSLFQRISSRYKAVSDADKLLKYEAKQ